MNKTKESLNSDGQQFHQYEQNEQSPLLCLFHSFGRLLYSVELLFFLPVAEFFFF